MSYFDNKKYPRLFSGEMWTLYPDPMGHGIIALGQGGFLMSPQQFEQIFREIKEFLDYHGREKIQQIVKQQWDSIPSMSSDYPIPATKLLYPEEYAQALAEYNKEKEDKKSIPKPRPDYSGFVYILLADNGLYKIGCTEDFNKRLLQLEPKLPYDLKPVVVIETEDMRELEESLHEKFANKRKKGEWFELNEEDIKYLKGLANG